MWKNINGKLYHITDNSRVKFRTNISKQILDQLSELADRSDTHINYLLENGLENLLKNSLIIYNRETIPKDRVQYKTTYDRELLSNVREFAQQHNIFISDVIEYSVRMIDIDTVKNKNHKHRVERI